MIKEFFLFFLHTDLVSSSKIKGRVVNKNAKTGVLRFNSKCSRKTLYSKKNTTDPFKIGMLLRS